MIAFSEALGNGSMGLTVLHLLNNNITDDGLALLIPLFKTEGGKLQSATKMIAQIALTAAVLHRVMTLAALPDDHFATMNSDNL